MFFNNIEFFSVEKKVKYVPSVDDLDKVIACDDNDTQGLSLTLRKFLIVEWAVPTKYR
jgi:hypothetical protein